MELLLYGDALIGVGESADGRPGRQEGPAGSFVVQPCREQIKTA